MNDTELLKVLLGHLCITETDDIDWPYSDTVEGLRDAGLPYCNIRHISGGNTVVVALTCEDCRAYEECPAAVNKGSMFCRNLRKKLRVAIT